LIAEGNIEAFGAAFNWYTCLVAGSIVGVPAPTKQYGTGQLRDGQGDPFGFLNIR
jgi:hypothetical protein